MGISNGSRKIVGISLFVFWAVVTAVLVAGLLFYDSRNNPINNSSLIADPSLIKNNTEEMILSAQEVAKHSAASDCWMVIDSKVYNFTSYLVAHPGGAVSMIPYCGKDGSQAFATKDQNSPKSHSNYAKSLFADYYIGDIDQTINKQPDLSLGQYPSPSDKVPVPTAPALSAPPIVSDPSITLNAQEVAKHNTAGNCWMIINSKVYNLTSYLGSHPGGVGAITPYCGKDGAQAFLGLPHSSYANSLLAKYFIGNLNQATAASQIQQNIQNTAQVTPPPNSRRDDDEDDD